MQQRAQIVKFTIYRDIFFFRLEKKNERMKKKKDKKKEKLLLNECQKKINVNIW